MQYTLERVVNQTCREVLERHRLEGPAIAALWLWSQREPQSRFVVLEHKGPERYAPVR